MHTGHQSEMANHVTGNYLATEYLGSLETDVFEIAPNHFIHVEQHRDSTQRDYQVGEPVEISWPTKPAYCSGNLLRPRRAPKTPAWTAGP
ncbi:MAG: hypothetical protein CM1200mP20_06910 [Pseudomonadota bacterium]|nr:MAG: hypothetical protein CM1200mP20_06910 [Pseudomonadota bacterium]